MGLEGAARPFAAIMAVGTAAAQLAGDQHTLRKWATAPHARRTSLRGYRTPALRQGGLRIRGPGL